MAEKYELTEIDKLHGREAYITYLGGMSIVHNPDSEISASLIGDFAGVERDEADDIILRLAESLIWNGLRDIIIAANPPELRSPIVRAEHNHDEAIINIHEIIDDVCENQAERLVIIDDSIRAIRPMPANDPNLYTQICHSRMGNIYTSRLMGGFMPSMRFRYMLPSRRLSDLGE